jgi:alpha(1,3/1,4) fucosyltransferase
MKSPAQRIGIYFDPPSQHFLRNRLFDVDERQLTGDRIQEPYAFIKRYFTSKGVTVDTADYLPEEPDSTRKIYVSLGMLNAYGKLAQRPDVTLSAFFAMECPIVEPSIFRALPRIQPYFKRIYSWSDSASIQQFTGRPLPLKHLFWPQAFDHIHEDTWAQTERKFLVMINANKLPRVYWNELYTERMRAVEFFNRTNEIDLYGKGWDGPSYRVGTTWVPHTFRALGRSFLKHWYTFKPNPLLAAAQRAYRGPAVSKSKTMGSYTFALCFENAVIKGWITEKIFDCFFCGTIPIYWGAPEITDYVPAESFIDRRHFETYADLRTFLHSLNVRQIQAYRDGARAFIQSDKFRRFSKGAFLDLFREMVSEDAGVQL